MEYKIWYLKSLGILGDFHMKFEKVNELKKKRKEETLTITKEHENLFRY